MERRRWFGGIDPFREISRLQREMNDLFNTHRWWPRSARNGEYPPLNILRAEDDLIVSVELPGMSMEEIELSMTGDTLTLKGERKAVELPNGETTCHRTERPIGAFMRTIKLPERTDPEKAEARYVNGMLTIRIPKDESAKPRKIGVKAS